MTVLATALRHILVPGPGGGSSALSGRSNAAASARASLGLQRALAAVIPAASGLSAEMGLDRLIAGAVEASSSVGGELSFDAEVLAGSLSASGALGDAPLDVARAIVAQAASASAFGGASLERARAIVAQAASASAFGGALSVAAAASRQPYSAAVLADSPLSYWRLGESSGTAAADEKGVNAGTYSGSPTLGATGLLKGTDAANTAVTFDGVNDYMGIASMTINVNTAFTVEFLVKVTSLPGTQQQVFHVFKTGTVDDLAVRYQTDGKLAAFIYDDSAALRRMECISAAALPLNQEVHVAYAHNGVTGKLYINGQLSATSAANGGAQAVGTTGVSVRVGANVAGSSYFAGTIDEVAVYQANLSAATVAAHYSAALRTYSAEVLADSPAGYWRLGEASGTVATDASGNARHGTYVGAPTLGVAGAKGGDAAVTLDGSTQHINLTNLGGMTIGGSNPLTVEAWFKASNATAAQMILGMIDNDQNARAIALYWGDVGGTLYPRFDFKSGAQSKNVYAIPNKTALCNNAWHHVVAVYYDASTPMDIYIDGALSIQTRTQTETTSTTGAIVEPIFAGARNTDGAATLHWAATLDEVAIYPSALSAARVAAHYAASGSKATGGVITEAGGYRYHTFTGQGTFLALEDLVCDVLVVGGGGGADGGLSGVWYSAPGGGGVVTQLLGAAVPAGGYPVAVGAAGAGCTTSGCSASAGGTSSVTGIDGATAAGGPGASAGVPGTSGSGNARGTGSGTATGGAGGDGGPGGNASGTVGGAGGPGTIAFNGVAYGGGGKGQGSGGVGAATTSAAASGFGTGGSVQAAGFSGTVVIRYPVSDDALPVPGASFQAVADRGSTGGVANGATVAQWVPIVDADGVGTATGGTLGLWVASDPAFNGRPVVQFTAATIRAMEWATLSGYTDGEIFWVGVIDEVGSTDGPYVLRVRNSSNSIALLIYNAGATTRAAAYVPAQSNKTVTSLLGTPAVAGFSWVASAGVNYYHNGVAVGSAYAGTMGNLRQKINFTGGTAASGGGGFRVAEIVAFKFKLSPTQRAAMQAYFAAKYGIA